MKKLYLLCLLASVIAFGDGINEQKRTTRSFRLSAVMENVPVSPTSAAGGGSLVLSAIANAQHMILCHESSARIRVNWTAGTPALQSDVPLSSVYDMIIPAAASGSYSCFTADDIQLSSSVYIWSDGSAVSSGLFYGSVW